MRPTVRCALAPLALTALNANLASFLNPPLPSALPPVQLASIKIRPRAFVKRVMLRVSHVLAPTQMTVLAASQASPCKLMELVPVQMAPTSVISLLHVILALLPAQIATHLPPPALLVLLLLF